MNYKLPILNYSYDALEPYIDSKTMEIHHSKHHQTYIDKLNTSIEGTQLESKSLEEMFENIDKLPIAVRNNGGGTFNHNLYWDIMSPSGGGKPEGNLLYEIENTFGSFEKLQEELENAGITQFGSGWAWLIIDNNGKLKITKTPNQDNPMMNIINEEDRGKPILGIDVWEHAYYLQYQNKRPEYLKNFWNVIDWKKVEQYFEKYR
ncbi:superoxide dismutase [Candidatus Absconditicoccus praedator]|uniref:superoxide dismutase n=1 Tax=Candidatus Absconditicoccus praedator TaxID=2735562 RepID=UPI001E4558E3|nr:superoxide dismutase [Candidatus Absconditicoccus praedator]UFX83485.1 superoxide dismutase [Candidatus Absconditicoccus praedator]